jgi:hypothetical protein
LSPKQFITSPTPKPKAKKIKTIKGTKDMRKKKNWK